MSTIGGAGSDWRRTPPGRAFTIFWVAVFTAGLVASLWGRATWWEWALGGVGAAAWLVRTFVPARMPRIQLGLELVLVVVGALLGLTTNLLGSVLLALGAAFAIRDPRRGIRTVILVLGVAIVSCAASVVVFWPLDARHQLYAFGLLGVLLVSSAVGFFRRQAQLSADREQERESERTRIARLDDHARVARELHDVLAHGLGGLVVQLDAVDALLESGRTEDAHDRIRAAQRLARDGLADARRAVEALRSDSDEPPVPAARLAAQLDELVAAHRGLGGRVDARITVAGPVVAAPAAAAVRRALQEGLSNARKHAPGEPVTVRIERTGDRIALTVENPIGPAGELADSGGRHGLSGMRERFAALDGGAVDAREEDGVFRVHAEATA